MIEVNMMCPEAYTNIPFDKKIGLFEYFWEKDVPKFGEDVSRIVLYYT